MLRRLVFSLALCAVALMAVLTPACTGQTSNNVPEPDYASKITENLLQGINNGDYTAFSRDFDDSMLKALPAESFQKQFSDGTQGIIGNYQAASIRFFQATGQAQYITVVYYAAYSAEPGAVLIQISFHPIEGQPRVSGLFFNSPKLRK
jgi:hypothetical protein